MVEYNNNSIIDLRFGHAGRIKVDRNYRFMSIFNPENGDYVRTGIIDSNGNDTGEDPFMASYPELIDVGVMGNCLHGSSGLCIQSGIQCYQSGLSVNKPNMSLEDYHSILDQSQNKVFQVALGGRGDVNMHENFEDLLCLAREHNIVPNFTTSGLQFTENHAKICKEYCGAVAVSYYRSPYTFETIRLLLNAGVTTNIHYVLGSNTIDEAIRILNVQGEAIPSGINAIIFLLHKPVGLGSQDNVLKFGDPRINEFFGLIDSVKFPFKIGFDSCSIPAIVNLSNNINMASVDTCEGARFSMYISSDMIALPCSFDQEHKWAVDLKEFSIQEAWDSPQFQNFRDRMQLSCIKCERRVMCFGGCPIKAEIVLCKDKDA